MRKHIFYWVSLAILLPLFAYATTPYTIRNNSDMTGPPVIGHTTANTAYFSNLHATNFNVTTVLATTTRTNGLVVNGPINANGGLTAGVANIGVLSVTTLTNTTGNFTTLTATTANLTGISTVGVLAQSITTAGMKIRGVETPYYVTSSFVGGTQNTITLSPNPGITAYSGGQIFHFTAVSANTGNVTINVNGLGAKSLRKVVYDNAYSELYSGDILTKKTLSIVYDATTDYFIMLTQHTMQDHPLGEMFMYGNATATPIAVANTYYPVAGIGYANTINNGFSFTSTAANSNKLTYTASRTEITHSAITASVQSAGAGDIVRLALFKNGAIMSNGTASAKITNAADRVAIAFHVAAALNTSDVFELYIQSNGTNALTIVDFNVFVMGVFN